MFEKYKKPAAITATIAALGAASVRSAEALPQATPSHANAVYVEKNKPKFPQIAPEGVKSLVNRGQIEREAQYAINHLQKQWNGVLVFHKPKKFAEVSFTESPRAYAYPVEGLGSTVDPSRRHFIMIASQSGIENINGRPYIMVYFNDAHAWGFLDLKWAEEIGAMDVYAFKDSAPKDIPYDAAVLPRFDYMENVPPDFKIKTARDMNNQIRPVEPSLIMPHP